MLRGEVEIPTARPQLVRPPIAPAPLRDERRPLDDPSWAKSWNRCQFHKFTNRRAAELPASAQRRQKNERGFIDMSEKSETEILSRRKLFSILGLATLALAVPPTVLTISKAEAQAPSTPPSPQTGATAAPQTGRQGRRLARR